LDCNHETCDQQHAADNKHTVFVVAKTMEHRKQVMASLISLYNIVEFDNTLSAFAALQRLQPGVLLVEEDIPSHGGYEFVQQLRLIPAMQHIPTILLLSSEAPEKISSVTECGANAWLVKPYLRSELIKKISGLLNATVEQQWNALPPVQTRALKGTVEVFNNIADTIASGEPIAYHEVSNACMPLIEAVNSDNFMGILHGVRHHDNYTYVHSLRVATMLALFGHAINLPVHEQKILATGGLLHDVGKMSIPHAVLNKQGKLTEEEFGVMKSHVTETVRCLEVDESIPRGIITIAGQHHEKLDGTGYPYGLGAGKLNDLARMAAIVDIFSALTDRRVYKAPMSAEDALALMIDQMSTHIDLTLLNMFRQRFLDAMLTF